MKPIKFVLVAFCLALFCSCLWAQANVGDQPRCDSKGSMADLNDCAANEYRQADAQLNRVYAALLSQLNQPDPKADPDMQKWEKARLEKLKAAQRAWIQYRDLHCQAAAYEYEGGTMSPLAYSSCMTDLTKNRVRDLKNVYETEQRKLE